MKIANFLGNPKTEQTFMAKSKGYMKSVMDKVKGTDKNNKSINQLIKSRNQEYTTTKKSLQALHKGNMIDTKA